MDPSKMRDTLFRKYVQICELKLSEKDLMLEDASLKKMAISLLDLYRQEPPERFKLFRFYDIVENSLKTLKTSSLSALLTAFRILETFCINLFLYPWKKEFKTIKTFTGHFVYYIKSAMCEDDVWNILYFIGYHYEKETYELKNKVNTNHVKFISFELFLAGIECENLLEIYSQIKIRGFSELNVVQERKNSTDDVKGCIDAMKRQRRSMEGLHTSVAQMDFCRSDNERLTNNFGKHLMYKPSPTDSEETYLEKQLSKVHLTPVHRKKEAVYDSYEDITDEIFRPTPSLLAMSSSPRGGSEEYLQSPNGSWRAETNLNTSFHAVDDLDLYTAEDSRSTLPQRWTEAGSSYSTRLTKSNEARVMYHETPRTTKESVASAVALKCQMCGISSGTSSCQKCDIVLCSQCPCRHEYPRAVSILTRSSSVQNDLSAGSTLKEKCAYATTSQYQEQLSSSKSTNILRCGFCDKPGAKFTCVNCSKVSCNDCKSDYHLDLCSKNKFHNFFPNSQLNFKSSKNYTVFR
ncbi:spermatogenesis-associated protein 2 [Pristis pectinata]|uniref:spermatogenesis-associated protein 2 n=1 Tax=Pristis pectinata TaxID=685728 RepID=UPI00223D534A|nr:spermatogenesis-associated protein 2 [Pristis pectinata]